MCYQHRRAPVAHSQGQVRVSLVSVNEVYFWSAWRRFEKLERHLNCCHYRTRIRCTFTSFSTALVVSIGGLAWQLNLHSIISWCILIAAITEYEYVDFYLFFFNYYYFYQQWSRGKEEKRRDTNTSVGRLTRYTSPKRHVETLPDTSRRSAQWRIT